MIRDFSHIRRLSRNLLWYRTFERMLEALVHAGHGCRNKECIYCPLVRVLLSIEEG